MYIAIVFIIAVFIIVIASFYAYIKTFYVSNKQKAMGAHMQESPEYSKVAQHINTLIERFDAVPCEWVSIKANDGVTLFARYIEAQKGAPLHILFHGYRGSSSRDFCGGALLAQSRGHNTLVVDQRAHGKSEGHTITFGIKERYDCISWINYANKRFGKETPIILSGISMGGATVLMAAEFDLPSNVVGIIADCPFSSPTQIIRNVCKNIMKLPEKIVFPFIRLGGIIFGRFDINSATALDGVKNSKIPLLLIHGESDSLVPYQMSKKLYESSASSNIKLAVFPEAEHGLSYLVDPKRYEDLFDEFNKNVLQTKSDTV